MVVRVCRLCMRACVQIFSIHLRWQQVPLREQRQVDCWGLLAASLTPGSVRDPVLGNKDSVRAEYSMSSLAYMFTHEYTHTWCVCKHTHTNIFFKKIWIQYCHVSCGDQRCHSSGPFSSHDFSGHVIRSQLHPMWGGLLTPPSEICWKSWLWLGTPVIPAPSTQHPGNRDRILGLMAAGATY